MKLSLIIMQDINLQPRVAGRTFMNQKGFYIALDTIRPNKKMLEELQKFYKLTQSMKLFVLIILNIIKICIIGF